MSDEPITECTVGDVAAPSRNALVGGPFGSDLVSRDYVPTGVPVIRGANMGHGRWVGGEFVYVTPEKADSLASNCAKPGDLVFTQRGTLGQVALVPKKGADRYLISQSQMKVTLDPTKADALFLYYVFISAEQQAYIVQNAITTGVPHTNLGILRNTPLMLPPLAEQKAIAAVLGALDDKIELNRRMNATLEVMARTLFQSWFVDFDPVRAKLDGRKPIGLDPATAELFPEHIDHKVEGVVPTGWRASTLGEVIEISDSKRIPLSGRERELRQGAYPYHGAASVMDYVDDYLFDGTYVLMGEDGSVINDDGTPVLQYVWGKFWVNNHAHVLRGKNGVSTEHLLLHLKGCNIAPFVNGAVQPKLNQGNMNRIPFMIPPPEIGRAFAKTIDPLFSKIRANIDQSRTLATLRDTLLPKLLSGELSPKVIEEIKV
jgi:type I restriction enzyme, S subunit